MLFSYEFHYQKPMAPAPLPTKDGKDGGKQVVSKSPSMSTESPLRFLDGLKLSFGIQNVTNARPPKISYTQLFDSGPDATNTDASLYDPYQRQYYFVVTKKF